MKKSRLTPEEIDEILSKPFEIFKEPSEAAKAKGLIKRGPSEWQSAAFNWEFSWQKRLENYLTTHCHTLDNILAYGGSGGGKCLGKGTPILLFDGSIIPVEDIKVGDLLMGPDSKPRKVKSLARGREEMFKVIPKRGEYFICNRSHILSLKVNDLYKVKNGSIKNISIDNLLKLSKHDQDRHYLYKPEITMDFEGSYTFPIDPYFVGLWLGDGIHHSPEITNEDPEVIEYLKQLAEDYGLKLTTFPDKLHHYLANQTKSGHVKNPIIEELKKIGIFKNKHFPDFFLKASRLDRLQLLAGLIDSDGYATKQTKLSPKSRRGYVFVQKNKEFMDKVTLLARSLGLSVSDYGLRTHKIKGYDKIYSSYAIRIMGDLSAIPTKITRKQIEYCKYTKNPFVTRFSLESLGEGDYYGFELEGPDRLFLLGDFTVTHNTDLGVALNLFFLTAFPGCQTLCGADVYSDVEQIVIPKFKELLSIKSDWDHPALTHIPNKQDKYLDLSVPTFDKDGKFIGLKTSRAWFMHFSDYERLRGKEFSYIHFEEISQLKEERIVDELNRRLRSPISPFRVMYCTTNPPESRSHWLYNRWDLSNFDTDFEGDKPEAKVCKCQFCPECLNSESGEFAYNNLGYCSNPDCSFIKFRIKNKLSPISFKRPEYEFRGKTYFCPGDQKFWRVMHSTSLDNPHAPSSVAQDLKAGHDEANFAVYVKGEVRPLRSNKVFPSFSFNANTNQNDIAVDSSKNLVWSHDFNKRPRCSIVAQEHFSDEGDFTIQVLDEIVLYDTKKESLIPFKKRIKGVGPEHAAEEFIKRYKNWNEEGIEAGNQKVVYMHGDHTSLNNKMSPFSKNEFQIMYDMLTEAGFKVIICVVSVPGKMQVSQSDRITLTNWLLCDDKNINRIRINKRCKNLLKSLEDLERKSTDKEEIDKSCDELAREATSTTITHLISHPADALGYYLIRCFNLIKEDDVVKFIYIEGGNLLNIDTKTGKISQVPRAPYNNNQPGKMTQEDKEKAYSESYLSNLRQAIDQSINGIEEFDIFLNYFGK